MSVKTLHHQPDTSYFCTFTCNRWMNLFSETDCYSEIYKWFSLMVDIGYQLNGYVIMPNHLHFIIHTPHDSKSLNTRIGNGKRFLAYEIVRRLKQNNHHHILEILSSDVKPNEKKIKKLHQVFIDSFDAREILSEQMMVQKINYMHYNPVSKKWNLAENFIDYLHSSAKFYETGVQGIFNVTHYKDVWK